MKEPTLKKQQTKLQKLTKQDRDFVEKVVVTGKLTKSAQEAYDLDNARYATQKAQRLIAKDSIINAIEVKRETLKSALEKQGITPTKIAQKIDFLLESEDSGSIDKGLKHATNIYGVEDINEKPKSQTTYNFIFSPEVQTKIKVVDDEIKSLLTKKRDAQQD